MKILLTGSNGMLAYDFQKFNKKFEIWDCDKNSLDICDITQIEKKVKNLNPDIILNFAAYTKVDDAQDIGKKQNFDINTLGVYNLAKISKKYKIYFLTISTDYVFDGKNKNGYNENDNCNPINNYGMSKYLGEKLVKSENENSIIVRTSWLYGANQDYKNFVNTMLKISETKNELNVVEDQFGLPTYTKDLSEAIYQVVENIEKYRGQILHFSNSGNSISWKDFSQKIFELKKLDIKVLGVSSDEYKTKASRPKFSQLNNNSDIKLRNWENGLEEYLENL